VTLTDLTFLEEGNPDLTSDGQVNWQKRTLMARVLSEHTEYQRLSNYEIEESELLNTFLTAITAAYKKHDYYELSLELEPRRAIEKALQANN
jgi:son of sevenless-like protein